MSVPPQLPAAVLWDFDGTLVDTEPAWLAAEFALARRHGAPWTQADGVALVGQDLRASGRYIRDRMGLGQTPEQIVDELVGDMVDSIRTGISTRPGALALLAELRALGVPCALVTMSYQRMVEPALRQLPPGSFDVVVTGDTVTHGKPHPEAYRRSVNLLGVRGSECVAIEDSAPGAASARAAGTRVLVVPHHGQVPARLGFSLVPSLAGVRAKDLLTLAS